MSRSLLHKFVALFALIIFLGEHGDFLLVAMRTAPKLPAKHDYKCYCSQCYHYEEGCLCGTKPEKENESDSSGAALQKTVYKNCCCSSQELFLTFSSELSKCLVLEFLALAPNLPTDNDWPEDKVAALEDMFAPLIFHLPEISWRQA